MSRRRTSTLRTRFTTAMTICVIVLYSGTAWLVHWLAWRSSLGHLDERIRKQLEGFIADIDWQPGGIDLDFHHSSPPEFGEGSSRAFYELRDHRAEVIVRSYSLGMDASLPPPGATGAAGSARFDRLTDDIEVRTIGATFRPPLDEDADPALIEAPSLDGPENVFYLTVAGSTAEIAAHLHEMDIALLLGGIFLIAGSAAAAAMAARWLNQPVIQLAASAARIDASSLHQRLPEADTPAEMRPIVSQFNALLDRLERSMARERRFATGMAHELRTPVAELLTLAEVAMAEPATPGVDLVENPREVYQQTVVLARRMKRLIEVLSAIHDTQCERSVLRIEQVDLGALTRGLAHRYEPAAAERGVSIDLDLPPDTIVVATDATITSTLVENLLRNAVQYSDSPGHITIRAYSEGGIALAIANPAGALTADRLRLLCEPFWQQDESRSRAGSFGLGLTLCQAYARLLGALLTFDIENGNLTATLRWGSGAMGQPPTDEAGERRQLWGPAASES